MTDRPLAALIAAVAWASLAAQALVVARLGVGGPLAVLWVMALFFTIWANLAAAATFSAVALRGRPASASWHGAVLAWVALTGLVFHALLAAGAGAEGSPFAEGLGWWSTQGLHTAVPLLALLHWVLAAPKAGLDLRDALLWLLLPLLFCLFALARGAAEGSYVYPFLDPTALGWGGVGLSVLGLLVGVLLLHLLILGLARLLTRGLPRPGASAPAGPRPR
jgi:hypothetical protein